MKTIIFLIVILATLGLLCGGCAARPAAVSFGSLISQPEQYNGKTVTVEAIYARGWEWILLAEGVKFSDVKNFVGKEYRELEVVGNAIWFAGIMPIDVQNKLYTHSITETEIQYYGKVRVTGLFEYGGRYGHMNAYKYRITATKVESLDWTPPE